MQGHARHAISPGDVCPTDPVLVRRAWLRRVGLLHRRPWQVKRIHRGPEIPGELRVRRADVEIGHAIAREPAFAV